MRKNCFYITMMTAMLLIISMNSFAQDWPQWRGAQRDGVVKKTGINLDWNAKKPQIGRASCRERV